MSERAPELRPYTIVGVLKDLERKLAAERELRLAAEARADAAEEKCRAVKDRLGNILAEIARTDSRPFVRAAIRATLQSAAPVSD